MERRKRRGEGDPFAVEDGRGEGRGACWEGDVNWLDRGGGRSGEGGSQHPGRHVTDNIRIKPSQASKEVAEAFDEPEMLYNV